MEQRNEPDGKSRTVAAMVLVLVVAIGGAAALWLARSDQESPAPQPVATDETDPTPTPEDTALAPVQVEPSEQELWYVDGERLSWSATVMGGDLPAGIADEDPVSQTAAFWLQIQVGSVPGPVAETGGETAIPEGTDVLGVHREGSTLFIDLSSDFESGGGSLSMQLRVAQVVYAATQFEGIDAARLMIEGEMVDAIGGEGVMVSEPLTRRDFQDFAPNIVVEQPKPSQEFSPGHVVSGFANVFEANVSIEVVDANGKKLVETFTTATCGTGCWGDFSEAIEFDLSEPQEGRVNVLTYSAEDGSPQDVISIPVMLVP